MTGSLSASLLAFSVMALTAEAIRLEEEDVAELREVGITEEGVRQLDQQYTEGLPTFMCLMIPGFAAIVMVVMRQSGRTYPQHLAFSFHLHAFVFASSAVLLLLNPLGETAEGVSVLSRIVLATVYGVAALRTAYGLRWWGAVWRGSVILFVYAFWLGIGMTLVPMVGVGWWLTQTPAAPAT